MSSRYCKYSVHLSSTYREYNKQMSSMYCKYSEHLSSSCGKIYVSSNLPINRLAYAGTHLVRMDTSLVCRKFVLLNIKLLSVNESKECGYNSSQLFYSGSV